MEEPKSNDHKTTTTKLLNMTSSNDNTFRNASFSYLARGPTTVLAVIFSLLLPYIKEHCTLCVLLHFAVASLGLIWTYIDLSTFTGSAIRSGLNFVLEKIVLDDVLRTIYDPIDGVWACFVGTFMGASSMYGLQMDDSQRTELLQSSLGLRDESEAHSILLKPGGCKALLPHNIQKWLQDLPKEEHEGIPARVSASFNSSTSWSIHQAIDREGLDSVRSSFDCDTVDIDSCDTHIVEESSSRNSERKSFSSLDKHDNNVDDERSARILGSQRPGANLLGQSDPVSVFFRIIQNMARKKIASYAEALPRSKIENIGIVTAVAFAIQLCLRRSAKKSLPLEHLSAGIATISFGTILAREFFLGNVCDKKSMSVVCKDLASRILNKIKEKCAGNPTTFAMLVLMILCRKSPVSGSIHAKRNRR